MSKRRWVGSGLLVVLGGATLALSVFVGRASAAAFSNASYANRYECNLTSDDNFFTGIAVLNPNGSGTYVKGMLWVATNQFAGFNAASPPSQNFCTYALDVSGSGYSIGGNGLGTEVLTWTAVMTDNPACPPAGPGSTFTMSDSTVLSLGKRPSGATLLTQTSSNNFANQDEPGYGPCLK
jgi:hypothetical protein